MFANRRRCGVPLPLLALVLLQCFLSDASDHGFQPDGFGPTLVVKKAPSSPLLWTGVGCRVAVLNASEIGEYQPLALSDDLSEGCSNVVALGLSSDGSSAVCSDGLGNLTLVTLLRMNGNEAPSYTLDIEDLPSLLSSSFQATRVSNAVAFDDSDDQAATRDVYFIAANGADGSGKAVAVATPCGSSASFCAVAELAFNSSVNDLQAVPAEEHSTGVPVALLATVEKGLASLAFVLEGAHAKKVQDQPAAVAASLELQSVMPTAGSGANDGFALSPSQAMVTIAAQAGGLRMLSMDAGAEEGSAAVSGWAGGVRIHSLDSATGRASNGRGGSESGLALVAADPGLLAYVVSEAGDPSAWPDPTPAWACEIEGGGVGWNLDIDAAACRAFLADFDGGLQTISYCDSTGAPSDPQVIAHFGNGTMGTCLSTTRGEKKPQQGYSE